MKKIKRIFKVTIAMLFFGLLATFWYWQKNTFSKGDLKLEILGPTEADLLEEIEYIVKLKNNSNFRLDNPQLIFIAPPNSLKDEKFIESKVLGEEELGLAIYPGEEKNFSFKIQLLGKENETKTVKAILSYQPKNLKSRYQSETTFITVLKTTPITFEIDLPSKLPVGKNFTFKINYFSSLNFPLSDLRCQIEYPSRFEFLSSHPASIEKTEWVIPLLNNFQGGKIEINGNFSGEVGEIKIFKAKLGIVKEGRFIQLKEVSRGAELVKPFIFLKQKINNNPDYTAFPGDWLHYEIYFRNIKDTELNNLTLFSKLEGEAFDFSTIKSEMGIFHPGDNTIIFEWKNVPELQYLPPMKEGKVDFWVKLKEDFGNVKEPILRHKVFIGETSEEFVTKISSKLEIVQELFFSDEIFGNSGPLPPVVGEKTTYTILWRLKNYYSDVKDVKVKAKLPSWVELTGKIFPTEESKNFVFNSSNNKVIWTVGDLERGSGVLKLGKTLAFQIAFLPQEIHRGKSPELIFEIELEGLDSWTTAKLENKLPGITTASLEEARQNTEKGIVK